MNLYRRCAATGKTCSLIVNDTNLASGNPLSLDAIFQKEYKTLSWQLKIRDEKLQYDIKR